MSLPAAYISVILIWSTTPLAIKWSAAGAGFSFAVFARMAIGALLCLLLLCLLLLVALRVRLPLHRRARLACLASGLSMFGAMALTYWSAQYISSGMISVLFGLSPLLTSLLVALPLFFAAWWLADGHWPAVLPGRALAATLYLGVFGSVLGFALYYYMIKHMEAGRIALITLVTPVLALLLGHRLDNEAVLPQVWLGTASIVLGLCLHRWEAQLLAYLPLRGGRG
jgi:drug/metabolite transporter (DMT)-like permease